MTDSEWILGLYRLRSVSLYVVLNSTINSLLPLCVFSYPGTKVCFASSADTPLAEKIGRKTLTLLEVVPGVTVWDLVVGRDWNGDDINQIGRQPPLSANKSQTHFPILRELTKIRYDRMLFFDDCQWGDHCGQVERACKDDGRSVVTVRTPFGLGVDEWAEGLSKYAKLYLR